MKYGLMIMGGFLLLILLRKPLGWLGRVAARSGRGLAALWLLRGLGGLLGVELGVNLLTALVLGVLGGPGLALLLMVQWLVR